MAAKVGITSMFIHWEVSPDISWDGDPFTISITHSSSP
ncbi:hypothetical protein T4B_5247 [Trichinella pseudospiralis]|uniref:Uncharacterized protein n=1 Tax=Trichinella pseudospiralis TaxID=6337 RepID=A0A0V1GI42_TRIPS|nr:hypothetical protein T4B_5247 [Trichinella pseudospiralis]